jgi:hypothetical protein
MDQITISSHFVPQAYLRNWSSDNKRVYTRALLVPHQNFPEWQHRPIRSVAVHEHLYTSIRGGEESDAFEKWINTEVEDPAAEALRKVATDMPLTRAELHSLIRYAAALDKRTPASFMEQKARWEEWLPNLMQKTLARLPEHLARAKTTGGIKKPRESQPQPFPLPLQVRVGDLDQDQEFVPVEMEVASGRELWLHSLYHTLTHTYRALLQHQWSIVRPLRGTEWFTSDHPVIRLAYNSPTDYRFDGGWGQKGAEFILPLSPQHLLYTKVGHQFPADMQAKAELTAWTQRFIAERASRAIYAREPVRRAAWFRKRRVDADAFKEEQKAWEQFNEFQRTTAHD